ncbi:MULTISPECIES: photosystem II cytochrome c-550 [Planktothricoides]|uniref:Photosystem II extrinsic protein V n=2 Tax=Planktothricoides raciborskii TaxID=132608 RepID=A0AAU8J908_9CYAN|nr:MULTISPECIES: photosystem II cytochrome c-550 [Planktothricoides]KOR34684.1 cytochrome c-550 [Planktothricoides sp. SR001]MBD2547440.1 cytochrome c-550 [Planktothricoides raciborskii FACHB-1370]MBD2585933.1 cytochrome c-550 [Planktothricoides raciborskii FACHB-1261]
MVKRCIMVAVATVFFAFQVFVNSASAVQLSTEVRTLPLNATGDTVVVTEKEVEKGKRLFINVCSQCHLEGVTKTDFNVGLDPESLALATPPRNNIESLIDYMKNPTSYDGEYDISEIHPSMKSADIFAEMRNLTEDDLYAIASFMLVEPKVNVKWGGGKTVR